MKKIVKTVPLMLLMAATAMPALADEGLRQGAIRGRITDQTAQTLPGASIVIEQLNTSVVSDVNGYFTLANLKPGTYTVKVRYVGYRPVEMQVTVPDGRTIETNVEMGEMHNLKEAEVVSAFSDQKRALSMQKNAMGVRNVVSADQVGKFPDSNIGDALKRINGINVQYDQGEARFGQVRGTSADLTAVTINGNRLPSAEGGTRNVQLDLIPADMVQTIEVSKVVTADMDGDAIGGAINLVTKNVPSHRILNFTAGSGFNFISQKPQWNLGATWGNRFLNDKLGVLLAGSYQYAPIGSDNTEFDYELDQNGHPVLKEAQVRQYAVTRERQSYSAALDYKFNINHKIAFKGIYNRRNDWENRYRISYKKLTSSPSKQQLVVQTKGGAPGNKKARLERQQTMDFTLDGEHLIGIVKADWAASYSRATEHRPEERYFGVTYKGLDLASTVQDAGGRQPYVGMPIPSFADDGWKVTELTNSNQWIAENEWKGRMNFELPLSKGEFANSLRFGMKYVAKDKHLSKHLYDYADVLGSDWKSHTAGQVRDGFMPGNQYPIGQPFVDISYLSHLDFAGAAGKEVLEEESGNYDIKEKVTSGYVRFDQQLGRKLDAVVGLRMEHTALNTNGFRYDADNDALTPTGTYKHSYTDWLPSLLLKYDASDEFKLRASFTKTLARPKYSALVANVTYKLADMTATIGNPNTLPTTSYNYDLSAEYYFKQIGLVSLGLFYKDVHDVNVSTAWIGRDPRITAAPGEDFNITQDLNAYDARILGVEVAYQRDFGFIAPALKCLGFYGNYTYTHSSTRNYNEKLNVQPGDKVRMAGSPAHTANLSLYYENKGLNVRLSYNTASSFLDEMNATSRELDRYYDRVNYLDLNASYTWGKRFKTTVYAEANNLLNQPLRYYQGTKDRTMQVEYYGVRLNAGVKLNF